MALTSKFTHTCPAWRETQVGNRQPRSDPWPAPTVLPKLTQLDDCGDYESELALVFGKAAKNVDEAEALAFPS
ncbi:hypothetical protein MRS44_015047 [Fusarium solani]|uniref:uncharacterized protein n=1 Tax=Fusarium solani TaxID=169388 RepID=UPI0032C47D30|nr:hypothetical protein MRS44_015047 [Fusarium solani]